MSRKLAFLTMDSLEDFVCYDRLAIEPLAALGWQAEEIPWRKPDTNWNEYAAVIIRSPWDYQQNQDQFLACLEKIEASSALLENPLPVVQWNFQKTYLRDLKQNGMPIVPTLWASHFDPCQIAPWQTQLKSTELVIKPVVGAAAQNTWRMGGELSADTLSEISAAHKDGHFMVQRFLPQISTEGEFSLFYFNGDLSHAILKRPKPGDFRSQEEYGSDLISITPETNLRKAGERCLSSLQQCGHAIPLYARVDLIRFEEAIDGFAIMELELIEPSLYFNMDSAAASRFAQAINIRLGG